MISKATIVPFLFMVIGLFIVVWAENSYGWAVANPKYGALAKCRLAIFDIAGCIFVIIGIYRFLRTRMKERTKD